MEADPVLAVLLAIMAAEAHLQQFKEAAQRWEEVVTAGRLRMCAAWAHFRVMQRVQAKQRQARKRRHIRNLQILAESTFNWLVDALRDVLHRQRTEIHAPVSVEQRVAVVVWWMANNMSYRAVAHQFGLARSTMAGIVVEVTGAITERLLERVVYLCNPDRERGHAIPDVQPEGSTDDGLLEYEGPEGQRDCDHYGAGLQGPGLVSRDGVRVAPVQARLGCASCVAVAQSYPAMSRDCGGCVGSGPRPLIRGPMCVTVVGGDKMPAVLGPACVVGAGESTGPVKWGPV
ncbi:UNVERIFIED_CONTAM: hypothetical protein K2H54_048215 [Gekko kuhli]